MLYDTARKLLLTGLGVAVVTKERAEKAVQDWVKEGELSREEGRELLDTWMKRIDAEREEISRRVQGEVSKILSHTGVVSKRDYEELKERVEKLEAQLNSHHEQG